MRLKLLFTSCIVFVSLTTVVFPVLSSSNDRISNTFNNEDIIVLGQYDFWIDTIGNKSWQEVAAMPDTVFHTIPDDQKKTLGRMVYWLRFKIDNRARESIVIETPRNYRIAELYMPVDTGYQKQVFDIFLLWGQNNYFFNNPSFTVPVLASERNYYLRVKSDVMNGLGFVLYDTEFAHNKAIRKFIQIFLLIGIILIVTIYNAVFYVTIKDRAYLYYLFYLFSLLMYSLTLFGGTNFLFRGITYQHFYNTIPYIGMTISILLYVSKVLQLRSNMPFIYKMMLSVVMLRLIIFFMAILTNTDYLHSDMVDCICIFPFYIVTILSYNRNKSAFARLLFLSLSLIFMAFIAKSVFKAFLPISDYELGQDNDFLFFIFTALEVIMFSITLSQRYIQLKKENEKSHLETIKYQEIALAESLEKEQLKEMLNKELETMVAQRTADLRVANHALSEQAKHIEQINQLLQTDNEKLQSHVEQLNHIRLLDRNMSFEEFKTIFPQEEQCLGFVAGLKWQNGYECKKCGYKKFYTGYMPHSRKCRLCKYNESATANTLLDNIKFPLQKALYILYYVYSNPATNIHKLSLHVDLREGTTHNFHKKITEALQKRKPSQISEGDWTELIIHSN